MVPMYNTVTEQILSKAWCKSGARFSLHGFHELLSVDDLGTVAIRNTMQLLGNA